MTDIGKLIEEAAKAIYETRDDAYDIDVWEQLDSAQQERYVCDARVAVAVFEKAHTPTDNEREAQGWREAELYASADGDARDDFMTGWRTADRLRRSEVPEPSAPQSIAEAVEKMAEAETRRSCVEPQGEPSDARRAPLQAVRGVGPKGTISWDEHLEVWSAYAARYGDRQSAERIAERGGFGHSEVRSLLGREPRTFRVGGVR